MERPALRPFLQQLHSRHDTRCREGGEIRGFHGGEGAGECGRQTLLQDNTRQPDTERQESHRYEMNTGPLKRNGGIRLKEEIPTAGCPFFHAVTRRITTVSG